MSDLKREMSRIYHGMWLNEYYAKVVPTIIIRDLLEVFSDKRMKCHTLFQKLFFLIFYHIVIRTKIRTFCLIRGNYFVQVFTKIN